MIEKQNTLSRQIWILFAFWPILGFIYAWKNITLKSSKYVIICFYILYGLLYVINPDMDGARRAQALANAYEKPFSDVNYFIENLYESTLDFLDPFIIYTISRISNFHGILFGIYALIFGILMHKYLNLLFDKISLKTLNPNTIFFLWLLVLANSVFQIGGFRMWCAAWIFSLGTLHYIFDRKVFSIFIASISIIMHFSFLPLLMVLIFYHFFGNRIYIYGIMALLTFTVSEIDIPVLKNFAAMISPAHERKVEAYTGDLYIEKIAEYKENEAWFMKVGSKGVFYFSLLSMIILFRMRKKIKKDEFLESFFAFSLLLLSFSNITSLLPSGIRFRTVYYIFSFSTLLIYYNNHNFHYKFKLINYIGFIFAVIFIIIKIRVGMDTFNVFLIGPSFLLPFGLIDNMSLKELFF